jgi:hypothetical protein
MSLSVSASVQLTLPGEPSQDSASWAPGPPSFRRRSRRGMRNDPQRLPHGSAREKAGPRAWAGRELLRLALRVPPRVWPCPSPCALHPWKGEPSSARRPPGLSARTAQARTTFPRGLRGAGAGLGAGRKAGGSGLLTAAPYAPPSSPQSRRDWPGACSCACPGASIHSPRDPAIHTLVHSGIQRLLVHPRSPQH